MASNNYVAYQCIQVIMLIANFALAVYAFVWYFVKQILKLKNANYHIFMFTILMTALVGENVGIILNIVARAQEEQETVLSEQTIRIYRSTVVFGNLYWLLCNLAHTIFATKLWSLSLKLLAAVKIGSADSS